MNPCQFVEDLKNLSFENAFNPCSDRCEVHDLNDAPQRRAQVLLAVLEEATKQDIDSIWIGRDPGYRGGRRTGLALTDDVHFHTHTRRWGVSAERPTKGKAVAERTAAVIWQAISQIRTPIFLWNVFPLHPHEPDNPFSNRRHNHAESKVGEEFLSQLIGLLKPRRLIAVGEHAANTAQRMNMQNNVFKVRHPSYGGQNKFLSEVQKLYES